MVFLALAACEGGTGPGVDNGNGPDAPPATIEGQTSVQVGVSSTLSVANATGASGPPEWSSADPSIAGVTQTGVVSGVRPGTTTISARIPRQLGADLFVQTQVEVTPQPSPAILVAGRPDPTNIQLDFEAVEDGSAPPAEELELQNSGGGTLSGLTVAIVYNGGPASDWLGWELSTQTAPAVLKLEALTAGLAPGTYPATVVIQSPVAVNEVRVDVTLTVEPKPSIVLSDAQVSLQAPAGSDVPVTETVGIENGPSSFPLTGLATSVEYTTGQPDGWLTANLTSNTAPADLVLSANPDGLDKGTYDAVVTITSPVASNSPQTLRVSLTVGDAASIGLSSTSANFSAVAAGSAVTPATTTINVTNGGIGTLAGLTVASITYGASATGWLQASLAGATAPTTLTLTPSAPSGIATGTHTATVALSSTTSGVANKTVAVTLRVGATGPNAPSGLSLTVNNSFISVAWTDNSNDEASFEVQRRPTGGTWATVQTVGADITSWDDNTVAPLTTYDYQVRACDAGGACSSWADQATATSGPGGATGPNAPTGLSLNASSSTQIDLTWNDNSTNEDSFEIQQRISGQSVWNNVQTTAANVTSWSNTGLAPGTTYEYRIRACMGGTCSAYTGIQATTTPGVISGTPSNLQATSATPAAVVLTWQDNSSTETHFQIEEGGPTVSWSVIAQVGANVTTYTDTNVITDQTIQYRVRACDANGCTGSSNSITLNVPSTMPPPTAPSGLSVAAVSSSEIDVMWTDNSNDEDSFEIQQKRSGTPNWALIQTTGANVTSYRDSGLAGGTTYEYRVRACRSGSCSAWSQVRATTTNPAPMPPISPSGLTVVSASAQAVVLSWIDNSDNETSFEIEEGGPTVSWMSIGMVGANVVMFTDNNVITDQPIQYRVRACNAGGCSGSTSAVTLTVPSTAPPAEPTGLAVAAVSATEIDVTWTDASTDEDTFEIQRRLSGGSWANVHTVGPNVSSWRDNTLTSGTTYDYRVRACKNGGVCSAYTAPRTTTTLSGGSVPLSPSGLQFGATSAAAVVLNWTDNSNDETHFIIEEGGPTVSWAAIGQVNADVTTFTDVNVITGQLIQYRVRACNANGCSGSTNAIGITIP